MLLLLIKWLRTATANLHSQNLFPLHVPFIMARKYTSANETGAIGRVLHQNVGLVVCESEVKFQPPLKGKKWWTANQKLQLVSHVVTSATRHWIYTQIWSCSTYSSTVCGDIHQKGGKKKKKKSDVTKECFLWWRQGEQCWKSRIKTRDVIFFSLWVTHAVGTVHKSAWQKARRMSWKTLNLWC